MTSVPVVTLNDGKHIPQLGFGVWQVPDHEVVPVVEAALAAGYRSIDTAAAYGNEAGVGAAVAASAIPRDELFITTKLWNTEHGYDATLHALRQSLDRLKLDYLDLYLIHWPVAGSEQYIDSWKAFGQARSDGLIKSIGVSNFHQSHLRRLFEETDIVPAVNQIELHPNLPQAELRAFHAEHDIATEAWSPLGQGNLLADPTLGTVAQRYGKSVAQIILRWHIQLGNIVIPKSVTPERIRQNIDVFDFELTDDDLSTIASLDNGHRYGPDPDTFNWMG
jgi:diketogulonate reductase-like aldo/keto reductase